MAILAHVLQVVGWWIAPLIIFLTKRDSKFTSFHALQALFLQILYMMFMGVFMVAWFASFFLLIPHTPADKNAAPPPLLFVVFPLFWLAWMGSWVLMLVVAIVYGIKAGRGEWARYPVIGKLVSKILKIGPNGTPLPVSAP